MGQASSIFENLQQKEIVRVSTGLHSLDHSLHGGLILGSIYEIYGYTHVGKSTLSYFLAGKVRPNGKILLADFEHFDPNYMELCLRMSGFDGKVREADYEYGEKALESIRDALLDTDFQAAILDSVGALVTKAELDGELTDANMGLKARRIAPWIRQCLFALKRNPKACLFIINHLHAIMSLGNAATTHGGVAIHNNAHVRIRLSVEKRDDEYQIVNGRIDKLRYGGRGKKGRPFKFVLVPNVGIHPGLTAVNDAKWYGLLDDSPRIRLDGKDFGFFKSLAKEAINGETEKFEPFIKLIGDHLGTLDGTGDTEISTGN